MNLLFSLMHLLLLIPCCAGQGRRARQDRRGPSLRRDLKSDPVVEPDAYEFNVPLTFHLFQ